MKDRILADVLADLRAMYPKDAELLDAHLDSAMSAVTALQERISEISADHAARVAELTEAKDRAERRAADLEHRLANCDADLFNMQQELAEEELRSQALRAHADELAENLNDAERRLGEADKLVAAAMDFSKYAASILVGDHAPSQEWKDGFLELGEPLQIELAAWIEGQPA